jgi:hypothetical protein
MVVMNVLREEQTRKLHKKINPILLIMVVMNVLREEQTRKLHKKMHLSSFLIYQSELLH